jgi:hypothetical protein
MRQLDVRAWVRTPNRVRSPISGREGAFVHLELLELVLAEMVLVPVGETILGDLVAFELDASPRQVVDVVVRRARLHFLTPRPDPLPMPSIPPELAPWLARTKGGALHAREHIVVSGDAMRLRAMIDDAGTLRDDLAPVALDEMLA